MSSMYRAYGMFYVLIVGLILSGGAVAEEPCQPLTRSLFDDERNVTRNSLPAREVKAPDAKKPMRVCEQRPLAESKTSSKFGRAIVQVEATTRTELAANYAGLKFWHEGSEARTKSSFKFKTGDKVSFFFESNRPGFLYVVSFDVSNKPYPTLFPVGGASAAVSAFQPVSFSAHFVDSPGVEKVYALFSPEPVKDPYAIARATSRGRPDLQDGGGRPFEYKLADLGGNVATTRGLMPDVPMPSQPNVVGASNDDLRAYPVQVLTLSLSHEAM